MRKPVVLITGANGEIGHALVSNLAQQQKQVVSLDVNAPDPNDDTKYVFPVKAYRLENFYVSPTGTEDLRNCSTFARTCWRSTGSRCRRPGPSSPMPRW